MNEKTNIILTEILKWQRLQGITLLLEKIPTLLDDKKKKQVYELTDGLNSQATISEKVGVAGGTISNWWNLWCSNGILIKEEGRYTKIISLKELGVSI